MSGIASRETPVFDAFGRTIDRLERQLWAATWLGFAMRAAIMLGSGAVLILAITRGNPW